MHLGMSLGLNMQQRLVLSVQLPLPTNWSLVDAFKEEGHQPLRLEKKELDLSGMPLEQRLRTVDEANEVFRFAYTTKETSEGTTYCKIPLMRDKSVRIEDIAIPISKQTYKQATAILAGAGRFQRIARAVPYAQLYDDIKKYVEQQGCSLDETVIIGVDRGGRLPSFILREALGKTEGYTLKVDQAGGNNGDLDREKLETLIQAGILKEKFLLFVDSTVDSGRQIEVLQKYFDNQNWKTKIGHKGWGVAGSNENGRTLAHHCNINWGLDPDQSFEDNPELMGVDYAPGSRTKVIDRPTTTSEKIKAALLEVPRGTILDFSGVETWLKLDKLYQKRDKILASPTWQTCITKDVLPRRTLTTNLTELPSKEQRERIAIIGDGKRLTFPWEVAEALAQAIAPHYNVCAGTPSGNPGMLLMQCAKIRPGSAQLYQHADPERKPKTRELFGQPIIFRGETRAFCKESMIHDADRIIVLGGGSGTLTELLLAQFYQKPVYMLDNYGAVSRYAQRKKQLREHPQIHIFPELAELVAGLQKN
ncbi:MAG: hypothetical protein Q7R96_05050 [Nanoarchaeota archaeon]|nr:hypothetical protein [Nanoarchaeota archaeon]